MTSRPRQYYPTSYESPTLRKTIGKPMSVKTHDGFSICGGDLSGLRYAPTTSDPDAYTEDNGGLFFSESKSERVTHSLHSTNRNSKRKNMYLLQENQNPNASVSCRKIAKKQQQDLCFVNENRRPLNPLDLNVLTSHVTSKTSNNEKTKKKSPSAEPGCISVEACHSSNSDADTVDSEYNRGLCLQQENQNPNTPVSRRKNAKKQQQNLYYKNENKRLSNHNVLTSHLTSKTSNNVKTKKKSPSEEPGRITVEACHSSGLDVDPVDSEDNRGLCLQQENQNPNALCSCRKNANKQQQNLYYENENKRLPNRNVLTSHMTSKTSNNEKTKKSPSEESGRITVEACHSSDLDVDPVDSEDNRGLCLQQENQNPNTPVSRRKNAKKQQQDLYFVNENRRPLNPLDLNVPTSHMTSKTSNKEKTKKKKPLSEEPGCITVKACHSSDSDVDYVCRSSDSDDSVDSEDNRGLCSPETKSEKVSKGPARLSSLLSLLATSKNKNKDMQQQKAKFSNIPRGPSSIDGCLSFMTSKMKINEETKRHQLDKEQWEASWYQGIGKPNSKYGPHEMTYWVTVDGYFRKERGGGCGAIIRDELGKPIVAFSGISRVPVSFLHHQFEGMIEGLGLALKYQLLDIVLGCNSKRAVNIVSRVLGTINGCRSHGIGDSSFNVVCGRCVKQLTTFDEYPTVFPL
ncbi:uncharacterized protein LOC113310089 [Papaver somniferum]|uniref:uncharacterized protein LOC113310089 n=1 Tax=Papaver somniferum TaxID=3469 RepID=UPI000E6FCB32|nr:uncharacterized protein LOC113310089 [Papaver somniferum]XP_026414431.1 uncharacterized protein LOC113310089 [Papaver somniferum]XP_026414432.1 uncharacterized protein LOC113310089 [Papaver somniferum]XP_026414433.1 uncharacterized protein LOC113310089 [Papaver somniferum]XP_026414434.1 uncharacterized protein LOC113310089 [Papaver somniferum]XP_026414435.1 uncharacterized protein LOC113310089 [Papaver somniferum]XP_026414436.1 uncharacterized protein LOC113310089 [Papaver somniferum]XP_0